MDAAELDELHALRALLYGREAAPAADPAAVARLGELEDRLRGRRVPARHDDAAVDEASTAPQRSDRDRPENPNATDDDATGPQPGETGAAPRLSASTKTAWAASLVLIGAVGAVAGWALTTLLPSPSTNGAAQVATVPTSTTVQIPTGYFGAGPSPRVWTFHDLVVFDSGRGYFGDPGEAACITAMSIDEVPSPDEFDGRTYSTSSRMWMGCGVGAFPATVEMPVDSLPIGLRAEFADARGIQFAVDGDRLRVFLDEG